MHQLRPGAPTTSSISTKPGFPSKSSTLEFIFQSHVDRDKSLDDRGISGGGGWSPLSGSPRTHWSITGSRGRSGRILCSIAKGYFCQLIILRCTSTSRHKQLEKSLFMENSDARKCLFSICVAPHQIQFYFGRWREYNCSTDSSVGTQSGFRLLFPPLLSVSEAANYWLLRGESTPSLCCAGSY